MKIIANNRRMYIGGWLVAAAVLLGGNLTELGQLEFQPLAESPLIVNQLRLRLLQFDEFLTARRADSDVSLEPPIVMARLQQKTALSSPPPSVGVDETLTSSRTIRLPQLTGILQTVLDTGAQRYCAVLDGNVYAEKDSIAELRIEKISADGVVLGRRDQRWFIPAPEVYYSIGQTTITKPRDP